MKVLIVSHNAIGSATNLGITLAGLFRDFPPEQLAQLYVREEVPGSSCGSCYRITDREALAGVLTRHVPGREFHPAHLSAPPRPRPRDTLERVRRLRRNALMDMGRELYWSLSPWMSKGLKAWLHGVNPDVLFYAAGDYAFSFQMALDAAREVGKPLVVACYDDFFLYTKNGETPLGKIRHALYMRTVRKAMDYASGIVAICQPMARDYAQLFQKPCTVLYTPAPEMQRGPDENGKGIAYFGTLGLGRDRQLAAIGRAVAATGAQTGIHHIDVYTPERRKEALAQMTPENGIVLHPAVSREALGRILCRYAAVIHTESFDPALRKRVRCSISTKIPEALSCGPCLLAYGPEEAASMEYLAAHGAAFVVTKQEELEGSIVRLLTDKPLRAETLRRARQLAQENHSAAGNAQRLKRCLENAIQDFQQRKQNTEGAGMGK